jgi:hypothetical protein
MNGGVLHAVEVVSEAELQSSCAGFRFFGFAEVAELLEAASNEEWMGEGEERFNRIYGTLVDDEAIGDRFRRHIGGNRELYAP